MYLALRKLTIRLITPFSWRSPRRLAASINRFSQIEADSAWQMLQALESLEDVTFKAKLFENALEEVHHAALFSKLALRYADTPLGSASGKRKRLFSQGSKLAQFEAHHFVGEAEVYEQFLTYSRAAPHPEIADMFLEIRGDEEEHQKLAYEELIRLAGSEQEARRLIRQVRYTRFWEAFGRVSEGIGNVMSSLILTALYLVGAPIFAWACRSRLRDLTWQANASSAGPTPHS